MSKPSQRITLIELLVAVAVVAIIAAVATPVLWMVCANRAGPRPSRDC